MNPFGVITRFTISPRFDALLSIQFSFGSAETDNIIIEDVDCFALITCETIIWFYDMDKIIACGIAEKIESKYSARLKQICCEHLTKLKSPQGNRPCQL